MDKVKCNDCGLLSLRKSTDPAFLESDAENRSGGHLYGYLNGATSGPLCIAMAFDLRKETLDTVATPEPKRSLDIINKERDCPRFTKWKQGFTPKEHLEMLYADELRQLQSDQRKRDLEWQEEQREKDRKREEAREADERKHQLDQILADRKYHADQKENDEKKESVRKWWDRGWSAVVGIVAFVAGLLAFRYFGYKP